jgi:hypothetical protein
MMLPMNEIQMSMKNPVALLCFTGLAAGFDRYQWSIIFFFSSRSPCVVSCEVRFEFGSPTKMEQIS